MHQFLAQGGRRPSVRTDRPNHRIHVHVDQITAAVSLDLTGESLQAELPEEGGIRALEGKLGRSGIAVCG